MYAFNIRVSNIQSQIELVSNSYKDSLDNTLDNNINYIMAKIVYTKLRALRQIVSISKLCIPQNNNILKLLKNFGQADNKADEYSSSFTKQKCSFKLPQNIMPANHSIFNTKNINDIKWERVKTNAVKVYKGDMKQITLLKKVKYGNLALKKSI